MRNYPAFFLFASGLLACEGTQRSFDSEPSMLNPAGGQGNGAAGVGAAGNGAAAEVSTPPGSAAFGVEGQQVAGLTPGVTPTCSGADCAQAEGAADALPCNPDLSECGVPCAGCSIAGECVGAGSVNEDNACQICDPARSAVEWSNNDDGSCDDGLFCTLEDRCTQGACAGTRRECDDSVACNGVSVCDEMADACSPPENQCGAGGLCDVGTGACVNTCPGCNIGGVCLTSGAEQAGNPCQVCDPGRSSTSYSAAVGKACGAAAGTCSQQDTCDATGSCQPNHLPAGTACGNPTSNTCNQPDVCDGNGACSQRLAANGTPCEDGLFCTVGDQCSGGNCTGAARTCEDGISCNGVSQCDEAADRCTAGADQCGANARCDTATRACVGTCAGCLIGGACVQSAARQAGNPCMVCVPSRSATAFSIVEGNPCSGGTCNSSGQCVECSSDANCGDGNACNGLERCVAGQCQPGSTFPCPSPDPTNCQATCQSNSSGATCTAQALTGRGLTLMGTARTVAGVGTAPVAVAFSQGQFGLVASTGEGGVFFATLIDAPAGVAVSLGTRLVGPGGGNSYFGAQIHGRTLGQGQDDFLVTYGLGGRGGSTSLAMRVVSGIPGTEVTLGLERGPGDAAFRSNPDAWAVVDTSSEDVFLGTYSAANNAYLPASTAAEAVISPRIAASGANSAVVWQGNTNNQVELAAFVGAQAQPVRLLSSVGSSPDIAAIAGGDYGVAWVTSSGLVYQRVSSNGAFECEQALVFGGAPLRVEDRVAVASGSGGVFLLLARASGVRLYRVVGDACNVTDSVDLPRVRAGGLALPSSPALAVGNDSLVLVWAETNDSGTSTVVQRAAERRCE